MGPLKTDKIRQSDHQTLDRTRPGAPDGTVADSGVLGGGGVILPILGYMGGWGSWGWDLFVKFPWLAFEFGFGLAWI